MKFKMFNLGALILALLVSQGALAIEPPMPLPSGGPSGPPAAGTPPVAKNALPEVLPTPSPVTRSDGLPPGSVSSPWIDYTRPDCCGSMCGGPIGSEYYLRTGPSIPISTGILHDTLDTGWMTQGGGRALLFNRATTGAWTVDAGLSYTFSNGNRSDVSYTVPFLVLVQDPNNQFGNQIVQQQNFTVTTRDLQRWAVNLGFGHERYVTKPAYEPGWHWRVGWDVAGRWGYARLDLNDLTTLPDRIGYRHVSDVFGAAAVSVHEDVEIPMGNCVSFIAGLRAEWVYNWTDIVPPEAGRNLQEVNVLLNFGWRY